MKCKYCGYELAKTDNKCPRCNSYVGPSRKQARARRFIGVGLGILCMILGIFLAMELDIPDGGVVICLISVIIIFIALLGGGMDVSTAKEAEKVNEKTDNNLDKVRKQLQNLGVNVTSTDNAYDCVVKFSEYSEKVLKEKLNKLKKQYGFADYYDDDEIAFGESGIVIDIDTRSIDYHFSASPALFSDDNFISEVTKKWDFDKKAKLIPYSNIEFYELTGDIHYDTEVQGGGANVAGALKGGFLFGDAGAVIGSQIGTEITSKTKKSDDRSLVIHPYKHIDEEIYIFFNVDEILYDLRKRIPEKEYSYKQGYKATTQEKKEEKASISDELQEYKKLLDMGILTQEEFDAKKKQLLGF